MGAKGIVVAKQLRIRFEHQLHCKVQDVIPPGVLDQVVPQFVLSSHVYHVGKAILDGLKKKP